MSIYHLYSVFREVSFHLQLNHLSCSSFSPCLSFPFSLSAILSDVCCLFITGHRAVWNHWKAAGELQYDWSCVVQWCLSSRSFLSSIPHLSIRAAGSMSSGVNSLCLWRLVISLTIKNTKLTLYMSVITWTYPSLCKKPHNGSRSSCQALLCVCSSLSF